MLKLGLVVRMHAKPGKEAEVAEFLAGALPMAEAERFMPLWCAFRGQNGDFYIVDAFSDESGRELHLAGSIAHTLQRKAPELFDQPPHIEKLDVIAAKLSSL
ncbi:MAG TPA: antibiotic biosynthesis monooxygenase [Polyangiales bacterium]|nr:antibiotic biosynthesis monooxygenase [Polyangiales bacterium]